MGVGWLLGPLLGGFVRDSMGMYGLFTVFLIISATLLALAISKERGEKQTQLESSEGEESLTLLTSLSIWRDGHLPPTQTHSIC